jgi:hypothetical protein
VVQLDGDDQVGAVIVGVYDKADDDPVVSQLELRELARTAGVKSWMLWFKNGGQIQRRISEVESLRNLLFVASESVQICLSLTPS